jgi:hypothetical protein
VENHFARAAGNQSSKGASATDLVADGDIAFDQPSAQPSPSSRKWLTWPLALAAIALLLAVVGALVVLRSSATGARPVAAVSVPPNAPPGVNIRAGLNDPTFLDAGGSMWFGDRYFTGGQAFSRTGGQILRTLDQSLYQTGRMGNFSYAVPLQQGVYELHLHFAEIFFSPAAGADTQRTFDVSINGATVLTRFDIAKDAGGVYVADERIFKDISPGADGLLRLGFSGVRSQALLNGFEVLPGIRGKMAPVRILCSNHSAVDKNGFLWKADQHFSGGRIAERAEPIPDPGFGAFLSYRTGNFGYAIPVADGAYRVRLIFAEPVYGRDTPAAEAVGRRLFDIYCNGRAVVNGLDVFREAGGAYRVIEKTFRHVKADAQGKILLSFVPVKSYAVLLAIEVLAEKE